MSTQSVRNKQPPAMRVETKVIQRKSPFLDIIGDVQAPKIKTRKGDFLVANKTNDLAQSLPHRVHEMDVQVSHSVHTKV